MLNEFEKYMKDNLESARSSWDKESLWQDIEKQLPSKRRAWSPIILMTGLVGFSLAYLSYTTLLENPVAQDVKQDEFYAAELKTAHKSTSTLNTISNSDALHSDSSKRNISSADYNSDVFEKQDITSEVVNKQFIKSSIEQAAYQNATNGVPISDTGMAKAELSLSGKTLSVNVETDDKVEGKSSIIALPLLDRLNVLMESNHSLEMFPVLSSQELIVAPKKKRRMALGLLAGAGLTSRSLDASVNSDLLDVRENAEKQLENIFATANLSYFFSSRWSLEMGFEWRQISERMNFTEMESSVDSRYIDTAQYYTNFMGQLAYNGKEVDVITRRQRENIVYNKHVQLLMPIHLGYTHKVSRMGLSFVAGPVISLIHKYKGARITEDLELEKSLDISTSGGSVLHGFDIGFNASLDVGPHYALIMGLNYRKALTSFTIDNIGNQSYDLLDARLGLLIHLN